MATCIGTEQAVYCNNIIANAGAMCSQCRLVKQKRHINEIITYISFSNMSDVPVYICTEVAHW